MTGMTAISKERKHHQIKFGTDGWRALIAKEFTYDNLQLTVAAIASYINSDLREDEDKPVVIGYDTRFLADNFAKFTAEILNSFGIKVKIVEHPIPTPVMAHAAREENSFGAIIFTASHNPPEYMGLKYFPAYGGPATVDITNKILEHIDRLALEPNEKWRGADKAITDTFDPSEAYFRDLEKIIDFDLIKKQSSGGKLRVVYDPIYGAGRGYANKMLEKAGYKVATLNDYRDPLFGGGMPEPREEFLASLKQEVLDTEAIFGAANDGDADRFAIIGEDGEFYPANKVLPIMLKYLVENKGVEGCVARTVSTTHLLDDVAEKLGQSKVETAVGFKWIGEVMRKQNTIIGCEESGGMSIYGHIPEKDGVLAILLTAELLAATGKKISQLWEEVQDFVGKKYFYDRLDLHMDGPVKDEFVKTFKEKTPKEIAGFQVTKVDTTEGAKIYLDNGSWLLARPSGTEAMCRVYFEGNDKSELDTLVSGVRKILDNISSKF